MKRKLLAGIVVAALAAIVTPAANAGPVVPTLKIYEARFSTLQSGSHTATGGCFFVAENGGLLTSGSFQGTLGDASVTTNAGTPTNATVTCDIRVNGVVVEGPYSTGNGTTQSGEWPISFVAIEGDTVTLCESVHWSDGTPASNNCQAATEVTVQPIADLVAVVGGVVDPIVCPILASLAGGYPSVFPVVVIRPDGDVYLPFPGLVLYDCPPY